MSSDELLYVHHMLDTARKAVSLLGDRDRSAFDADETLRLALTHLIQILGEAARRVPAKYRETCPDVPWLEIVGMRNKVVHDYLSVDYDVVWAVVSSDLPELITALEACFDSDTLPPAD